MKTRFTLCLIGLIFLSDFSLKSQNALDFGGTSYITFGNNSKLGISQFTLECWFMRHGTGTTTSTGTGGLTTAIPLVSKGKSENDGSTVDMNYFLGIDNSTGKIGADFEEGAGGTNPGLNHPVLGTTVIALNTWYHAAVTYDGTTWNLYLNGSLETTLFIGKPLQNLSIQHAAIATAINSTGVNQGYFDGIIDEVRLWNKALTVDEIRSNINKKIMSPTSNLQARWGLDEGTGTTITDISGNNISGTLTGSGYTWTNQNAPFNINIAPDKPIQISPANNDKCQSGTAALSVQVKDIDSDSLTVDYFGRIQKPKSKKFTVIGLPDTQFYTAEKNGGKNSSFKAQTNWIVNQKDNLNIQFVVHYGDITDSNTINNWKRADTAMSFLENPATTGLTEGIPYIMSIGNHDMSNGTTMYNSFFGKNRFGKRKYFGGNYSNNLNNYFDLFQSDSLKFIVISLQYNPSASIINWADSALKANANAYAIVVSHAILDAAGAFSTEGGQNIYSVLKTNPNLMLMLCGHVSGESQRSDIYFGNQSYSLLSDYQSYTNGGNGYMRIMEFDPYANKINIKTYSPVLNQYETDANSQFSLNYSFNLNTNTFQKLKQVKIPATDQLSSFNWNNLQTGNTFEWYVQVSDSKNTVSSTISNFSTNKLNPTITFQNGILTSTVKTGNQWYNEQGIINGETNDTYKPVSDGIYYSRVNSNGCISDTSNNIKVVLTGLQEIKMFAFQIYPNPASHTIHIYFQSEEAVKIELISLTDQVIFSKQIENPSGTIEKVDVTSLPSGVYFFKLISNNKTIVKKIIKE